MLDWWNRLDILSVMQGRSHTSIGAQEVSMYMHGSSTRTQEFPANNQKAFFDIP